jgi:hypothetical protein
MDFWFNTDTVGFDYNSPGGSAFHAAARVVYGSYWHTISLSRTGIDEFVFVVDDSSWTVKSTGVLDSMPPTRLSVGAAQFDAHECYRYDGCIADIKINGELLTNFQKVGNVTENCA